MHEETISSKHIYKGRMINFRDDKVKLSNGKISSREICEHPGAVAVVPITKNGDLVLIRQFRKPIEEIIYEIPAGLVNKKEGLKKAAARELEEETGYKSKKIEYIFTIYTSPGYSTERLHIFTAKKLIKTQDNQDEDEQIETETISIGKALNFIKKGKIKDAKTIIGIFYATIFPRIH